MDKFNLSRFSNPFIPTYFRYICWLVAGIILASLAIFFASTFIMRQGFNEHIHYDLSIMRRVVDDLVSNQRIRLLREATLLAEMHELSKAIVDRNYAILKGITKKAMYGANANFTTIIDENGYVLARGHSDKKGDNIGRQPFIRRALDGETTVDIVRLDNNGLSVAAAVPVFISGYQVGVLLFGDSFHTHYFVDEVKSVTGLEMTIFDRDTRISSTIIHNDKSVVGTKLTDQKILHTVLDEKKDFVGRLTLFDRQYETVYWPLQSDMGITLGMYFIGVEVESVEKIIIRIAILCLFSALAIAFVLSLLGILFLRKLVNPLERRAYVDGLTGITNRAGFEKISDRLFWEQSSKGALFLVDLDNFKIINDTLGHPVGDEVLIHTAHALKTVFRNSDIVARLGGDEFAVYVPSMEDTGVIEAKALQFLQTVQKSYDVPNGDSIVVKASVGVAIFPEHGATRDLLYNNADVALYTAKQKGKGCFVLYDSAMDMLGSNGQSS